MNSDIRLLVCSDNTGAQNVAREVANECAGSRPISIKLVSQQADLTEAGQSQYKEMLLLYLNDQAFLDSNGSVRVLVKQAMDLKISIIPVHEQDAQKGSCRFGIIVDQTPQELLNPPYKIWDTLSIPLFQVSAAEHRKISLRHILNRMGASQSSGVPRARYSTDAENSGAGQGPPVSETGAAGISHSGMGTTLSSSVQLSTDAENSGAGLNPYNSVTDEAGINQSDTPQREVLASIPFVLLSISVCSQF